jgi:protein-S-isoprenylcysteine O-methyltransferase Ste14
MIPVVLTAVCWLAIDVSWIGAGRKMKHAIAPAPPPLPWHQRMYFMVRGLEIWLLCYLPLGSVPVLGWRFIPSSSLLTIIGVLICAVGAGLAIWSRRVLDTNWNAAATLTENHALVTAGPFGIVRHPIYLGLLLAMIGTALVIGQVRALLPIRNILVAWKKIAAEEGLLRERYPHEYPAYQLRVKRLLPWVF